MFDVGFWEILLILVLALVIIGPERLPSAARKAGFFVGKARRYIEGVRSEVEEQLDVGEFKRLLHNQEVQINELQQQIKSGVDDFSSDLNKELPTSDFLSDVSEHDFMGDDQASKAAASKLSDDRQSDPEQPTSEQPERTDSNLTAAEDVQASTPDKEKS